MILKENNNVEITGELNSSQKMNISASVEAHIIKIVTENAYSDSIGSTIREQLSNSLDSLTESGKPGHAQLNFFRKDKNDYYSDYILQFEDKGLGLDKENFQKYIMGIGESSKRDKDYLLGAFGLGSKAGLGIEGVANLTYLCRKDGIERKFLIFKSNPVPNSTMLYEKPTEEEDGVLVEIEISRHHQTKVIKAIKEQCSYFENVYFNVEGIDNTYNIIKYPDFQWNTLNHFDKMHISLKGVKYDIDWEILEMPPLSIPIALRFDDYNTLQPIFNRESITWDKDAIQAVKNKIAIVSDYFVSKYNETVQEEFATLFDAWEFIKEDKYVELNDKSFQINELLQYSTVRLENIKVKDIKFKTPEFYKDNFEFKEEYNVLYTKGYNGRYNKNGYIASYDIDNKKSIYLIDYNFSGLVRDYLKKDNPSYIVQKKIDLKTLNFYKTTLSLKTHPKLEWRDRIKEYDSVKKSVYSALISDKTGMKEKKEFLDWKEANKTYYKSIGNYKALDKQEGEVTLHAAKKSDRSELGWIFEKATHTIESLHRNPYNSLIFSVKEKEIAASYADVLNKTKVFLCGERDLKYITQKNHMVFAKLTKIEKPREFKRIATSILFSKLLTEIKSISVVMETTFKQEFELELESIQKLKQFVRNNEVNATNNLAQELFQKALETNDFDFSLWNEYLKVKEIKENLSFLQYIRVKDDYGNKSEEAVKLINQLILLNKKKNPEFFTNFDVTYRPEVIPAEVEEYLELQEIDLNYQAQICA